MAILSNFGNIKTKSPNKIAKIAEISIVTAILLNLRVV